MKSKNLAFLLLVGLIAPSAVMSVESFNTVTPDSEGMNSKKRTALKEKTINLHRSIQGKEDNTDYQPQEGFNISSKKDLFDILKILLQCIDHIADGNPSKCAKAGTVIKEYFQAYTTLDPDSWDDDLIQLWNAPPIKTHLKLQAIQNAVNKISNNIGSIINQSDENEEFNILIKEMESSIKVVKEELTTFEKLAKKYSPPQGLAPELYDSTDTNFDQHTHFVMSEMSEILKEQKLKEHVERINQPGYDPKHEEEAEIMEINATEAYNKELTEEYNKLIKEQDEDRSQKDPEFKVFFKAKPIYLKKRAQAEEQCQKFINYFVSVRDTDSEKSGLMQKNILDSIEIILDYIENSSKQNSSTKDRKRDQKEEEKRTEEDKRNGKRHGERDSGRDSDK